MSKVPTAAECYYEDVRARIGTTSEYARASSRGASTAVRSIVVKPVDPARIRAMEEGLENARRDLER